MRIEKTLKNSIFAVLSAVILSVSTLLLRKVFLDNLSIDFLGYEGLFSNIFAVFSLADLGLESVILYRLFPAFANKDEEEINYTLSIYKKAYKIIGILVFAVGVALIPFLQYLVNENNLDRNFLYTIYLIQLLTVLCTYFLAYKRILFSVDQREYECVKVDTIVGLFFNVIKIVLLVLYKNYIMYLLCTLVVNITSNVIISIKVKKDYPFINNKYSSSERINDNKVFKKDIKNNLYQKLAATVYGGSSNIIATVMLGVEYVGLMSNYILIQSYVTSLLTKIINPFKMSIGNYVYSNNDDNDSLFRMFDFISYIIACFVCVCYLVMFNPFISLWIGEEYLLGIDFIIAFIINQYINWNHNLLYQFRSSFGNFEIDKPYYIASAIVSIVFSIVFCERFGLSGVILGTAFGHFIIWCGRAKVLYTVYIKENITNYIKRQIIRLFLAVVLFAVIYNVCQNIEISIFGLFIRFLICAAILFIYIIVIFNRTQEYRMFMEYIKKIFMAIKKTIFKK